MKIAQRKFPRLFLYSVCAAILYMGLSTLWIIFQTGSQMTTSLSDILIATLGTIGAIVIGLRRGKRSISGTSSSRLRFAQRRGTIFFLLIMTLGLLSSAVYLYNIVILHRWPVPAPSLADLFYLLSYPCIMLYLLSMPTYSFARGAQRARILTQSLVILVILFIFAWYFLLGPLLLQGSDITRNAITNITYVIVTMTLICCLVHMLSRLSTPQLRPALLLSGGGLLMVTVTIIAAGFMTLFKTGMLFPLASQALLGAYFFSGLATQVLRHAHEQQPVDGTAEERATLHPLFSSSLVTGLYTLLLVLVLVLALFVWNTGKHGVIEWGVYGGGVIVILLLFFHQLLVQREISSYARGKEQLNHELHAANRRLETLATTDPLTGLANHRALSERLEQEVARAQRHGRPFSLLFLDLDHFKALNDGYGHKAGDEALRIFADLLRQQVRTVDMVGRWGGEEFIAILPETPSQEAQTVGERIRAAVNHQVFAIGSGLHLTCSIGAASYPDHAHRQEALVEAADQAMYAAKRLGRNQIRLIDEPVVRRLIAEEQERDREATALDGCIEALSALVHLHSSSLGEHSEQVAALVKHVALKLGSSPREAHMMQIAGRLYDIGMIGIPETILQKPDLLSEEEWRQMTQHASMGGEVVSHIPALRPLSALINAHHERWDGTGYPNQLSREHIPLGARIIAVVDAYVAMISARPSSKEEARAELWRGAGQQFDPAVVQALAELLQDHEDDGSQAVHIVHDQDTDAYHVIQMVGSGS